MKVSKEVQTDWLFQMFPLGGPYRHVPVILRNVLPIGPLIRFLMRNWLLISFLCDKESKWNYTCFISWILCFLSSRKPSSNFCPFECFFWASFLREECFSIIASTSSSPEVPWTGVALRPTSDWVDIRNVVRDAFQNCTITNIPKYIGHFWPARLPASAHWHICLLMPESLVLASFHREMENPPYKVNSRSKTQGPSAGKWVTKYTGVTKLAGFPVGKFIVHKDCCAQVDGNRQTFSLHQPSPSHPLFMPVPLPVISGGGSALVSFTNFMPIITAFDFYIIIPQPNISKLDDFSTSH